MVIEDPVHRGDVPPPLDVVGHLRDLARALLPALVIALVVGGAVFGLRTALVPKEYSASIITTISPAHELVPGDAFVEQMRAPFMGLAQDTDVLNQVLSEVDTGWDAATLRQHVELTPGPAPQLLVFTVTAGSPDLARRIVASMVVTVTQAAFANTARDVSRQIEQVQAAIAAEQARSGLLAPDDPSRADSDQRLGQLQTQLATLQNSSGDQLSILSTPEQDPTPISPQPVSEALVAGVATLIAAAELIVLWRSRFGRKPNRVWARRVARKYRAATTGPLGPGELPPLVSASLAQSQRAAHPVLVLLSAHAALPKSAAPPRDALNGHRHSLIKAELSAPWWRNVDAGQLTFAVVVVSVKDPDRKDAEQALSQLAEFGVPAALVLQQAGRGRGTRAPDEPASSPPPPSDPPAGHPDLESTAAQPTSRHGRGDDHV